MDVHEIIWSKFKQDVDLYKFYLDISVKTAIFVFGITGALTSYFFSSQEKDLLVYSLIFPLILNLGFCFLFHASVKASEEMKKEHEKTSEDLKGIEPYDMGPLPSVCRLLSCMFILASVGLVMMVARYIV